MSWPEQSASSVGRGKAESRETREDHYYDNSDTMVARAAALILLVETQGGALRPSNIMRQGDEEG